MAFSAATDASGRIELSSTRNTKRSLRVPNDTSKDSAASSTDQGSEDVRSAAAKVFGTTELLENILQCLESGHVDGLESIDSLGDRGAEELHTNEYDNIRRLFGLQRVSRSFRDTITGSMELRRIMGLEQRHVGVSLSAKSDGSKSQSPALGEVEGQLSTDYPTFPELRCDQLIHPFLHSGETVFFGSSLIGYLFGPLPLLECVHGKTLGITPGSVGVKADVQVLGTSSTPLQMTPLSVTIRLYLPQIQEGHRRTEPKTTGVESWRHTKVLSTRCPLRICFSLHTLELDFWYEDDFEDVDGEMTIGQLFDRMQEFYRLSLQDCKGRTRRSVRE